jgi:hypothetical protein
MPSGHVRVSSAFFEITLSRRGTNSWISADIESDSTTKRPFPE